MLKQNPQAVDGIGNHYIFTNKYIEKKTQTRYLDISRLCKYLLLQEFQMFYHRRRMGLSSLNKVFE